MTQHDQNIADQTFPNFRSDLNNALAALFSLSGGASAPSTTVAGMLWYDTTNGLIKQRNAADSGWITLFSIGDSDLLQASDAASVANILTGTSTALFVTPDALAAIWEQGSDIASASTLSIPSSGGGYFNVTGTTTITAISQGAALKTGREVTLKFAGALTLTHNATSLILPGGANITTAAGDVASFRCEDAGSNYWRCTHYQKANGQTIAAGSGGLTLLSTASASTSATIDFTSYLDSTYQEYLIDIINLVPASNGVELWLRVSEDAGSNWKSGASDYRWTNFTQVGGTAADSNTGDSKIKLNDGTYSIANTSNYSVNGQIRIFNPAGASLYKAFDSRLSYLYNGTSLANNIGAGAYIANTNAINGLRLLMSSGNITSGEFKLYGVKKS